jgi:hypothetical protein
MSSARKINSARNNGAKSRGPVTPEGRSASSMNAVRHALSSKTLVTSTESAADYQSLLDSFVDEYRPQGPTEAALVHRLACSVWRAHRYDSVETGMFDVEIERQAEDVDEEYVQIEPNQRLSLAFTSIVANSRKLEVLNRYALRDQRAFDKTLKLLLEIQASRPNQPQSPATPSPPQTQNLQNEPNPANAHPPGQEIHPGAD